MSTTRFGTVILLVFSITAIHLSVPVNRLPLHNYFRELYLIPIILGGLWYGVRGGLTVSIISSLVYLPHFFFIAPLEFHTRNIVEILLFNLVGYLVGRYHDTKKRDHIAAKNKTYPPPSTGKHVLFCVDNTYSSILTAEWFSKSFVKNPEAFVTLFWVSKSSADNNSEPSLKNDGHEKKVMQRGIDNLHRVKKILIKAGAEEDKIQIKIVDCDTESKVSDKILEELNSGQYDTVLVSKHEVTKTQEFIFGDTTLSLIRKSPVPVLVAKGPAT